MTIISLEYPSENGKMTAGGLKIRLRIQTGINNGECIRVNDSRFKAIESFLDTRHKEMIHLLEHIVNIDSFTHDREGVNRVGKALTDCLSRFDIACHSKKNEKYGDHIVAYRKGSKPGKILLMGHMDTPHPPGTVQKRPFTEDGIYAYGPGVADMKSGLVSMIYAVAALQQSGVETSDIEILLTPDEEIGSPVSRAIIEEKAKDASAVFNLEAGRPNGAVVTGRNGSAHFAFEIAGKAAHSGLCIEEGVSAIEELGYKIIELKKLSAPEKDISVNVGVVKGGIHTNVVAPQASGTIHVGFGSLEAYNTTLSQITTIINNSYVPGTVSKLTGNIGMLPMEKTGGVSKMYEIVKQAAELLDIPLSEMRTRGAADAGFPASLGIPTICGMGPVGGKYHSVDEYMVLESFLPRIKMLALSIAISSGRIGEKL
ncbi:M20 family metallopeptidase [Paenibacillus sp. GCM10012303]|uniref:M20 family metallopeptidase n=1 Tax=Paenibacillus sp. GCM10012303 TaxID=3317340 RepID=UPI003611BCFC